MDLFEDLDFGASSSDGLRFTRDGAAYTEISLPRELSRRFEEDLESFKEGLHDFLLTSSNRSKIAQVLQCYVRENRFTVDESSIDIDEGNVFVDKDGTGCVHVDFTNEDSPGCDELKHPYDDEVQLDIVIKDRAIVLAGPEIPERPPDEF